MSARHARGLPWPFGCEKLRAVLPQVRNSLWVVLVLLAACALGLAVAAVPAADASHRPSRPVAKAIKAVALRACGKRPGGCRFAGARVSSANPRFAWADVSGEGFSGALVKRDRPSSRRFRVVGTQGGGIGECAYWRARAPRAVLRDLRIFGLVDAASGAVRNCG